MLARVTSGCNAGCSNSAHQEHAPAACPTHALRPARRPLRSPRVSRLSVAAASRDSDANAATESRPSWQHRLAGTLAASALAASIVMSPAAVSAATAAEPFLTATGGQGLLRDQEAELFRLRAEKEGEVRQELDKARVELEKEGRNTQIGKLCATPFGVDIVGITELIALMGALVGGVTSRQRKDEVERLNEQLRKINMNLRQQARAGTIYAPGLNFMPADPIGNQSQQPFVNPQPDGGDVAVASPATATATAPANGSLAGDSATSPEAPATMKRAASMSSMMMSIDEDEMSSEARQCLTALKEGKRLLKEQAGAKALVHFEKALMLAKLVGNKVQERRAVRGLAAASRLQGQYPAAIEHLQRVLDISDEMGDHLGDSDAYGTIADIYTDMGDLDKAASFYDRYIDCMSGGGSPV